jgi:hypothetical protein
MLASIIGYISEGESENESEGESNCVVPRQFEKVMIA